MGDASINSDMPHSETLEHIVSYPTVKDTLDVLKKNPIGQKSIEISDAAYGTFVKPFFPFFETPASYAKPYIVKVDEFGNIILTKFDEKIPILKTETKDVKSAVLGYINWPFEKAGEVKQYVFSTYSDEYKKYGGDGIVAGGTALMGSSLVITSDVLHAITSFLIAKKDEAEAEFKQLTDESGKKYHEFMDEAGKKYKYYEDKATKEAKVLTDEAGKKYREYRDEAGKVYKQYADEAKKASEEVEAKVKAAADDAKKTAEDTKNEAKDTAKDAEKEAKDQTS